MGDYRADARIAGAPTICNVYAAAFGAAMSAAMGAGFDLAASLVTGSSLGTTQPSASSAPFRTVIEGQSGVAAGIPLQAVQPQVLQPRLMQTMHACHDALQLYEDGSLRRTARPPPDGR